MTLLTNVIASKMFKKIYIIFCPSKNKYYIKVLNRCYHNICFNANIYILDCLTKFYGFVAKYYFKQVMI